MTQPLHDNYRFLAHYNRWFNERLYDACEKLGDEERKRDRGAFFGSIHGTLNHLVWADTMWLGRFARQHTFAAFPPGLLDLPPQAAHATVLHEDWTTLRVQRERLDTAMEAWVAEMPDDFVTRTMNYSNSKGVQRAHPMWQALTHFFNHQTHHRGQVTTLLMQSGVDVGVTDLIALVNPSQLLNQ